MYDTVTLVLPRPPSWSLPSTLTKVREETDKSTGAIYLKGSLGNLSVKDKASDILITGSLPRYHHGSNSYTLNRATTKEAIQSISDALSLPLGEARVYRLDVGANIMLRHPVKDYLPTLGPFRRAYKREFVNGNVSYQGGQSTFTFYDKVLDLVRHGHALPEHWEGRNVLRIELQMKNSVKAQLGQAISGKDLWEEAVYLKAIQKWNGAYLTVEKMKLMEGLPMGGAKDYQEYMKYQYVQMVGYDNLLQAERMAYKLGHFTKDQAKERRRALKKVATYPKGEARGLIEELDQKVKTVVANYR
jgi:hypothetical protein